MSPTRYVRRAVCLMAGGLGLVTTAHLASAAVAKA